MNFGRKMMKAGVAAVAAIATLGAGGVVASTAFAGGGGGNQPGTGGDLAAVQFWQYKDDASGAWGPATSLDSVRAAMNNAGVTLEGDGVTKAQTALDQARTECETGFQRRHPGEGNGDCRVVAVGAVPAVIGGNYIYNGSGVASPTGTGGWYDNWNTYVAPNTYKYAGTQNYHTSDGFSDDPSNSVDAIMRRNVEASSKPSIVVIVLDKYQPAPPSYHLSISTQAAEMSGQAGDTKDASDTITLSSDGSKTENVNGTATLHWRGVDGTEKTVAKRFTASNKGSATVSASFKDMDASWESWPAGKRWWDVDVAKQGNMAEAVSHKGENDGKESGEKTTTPPEKWLTNEAGDTVRDGNDSIASGSLYTAHIKAHSNASGKFWIYDTIDTKDVTVKVGGDSIDGKSVYLNHTFLYRLDSSILPPDRAYQTVTDWGGTDQLNTEYDQYLGNWAVYASRDLYRDGQMLAAKGEKIAGSGFDSSKFGGNLFTVDADDNGKVTADATQTYLDLVSADNEHEAGWRLYLQCKRIAVADEVPNTWTETINGQPRESNKVVTKTPDMTPSIHLEKVDAPTLKQEGQEQADRDDPKQALKMDADNIGITFIITNTSKTDPATGDGAWYKASDLNLDDSTIVGDAHVDMDSLAYPADWDTLVLKPGESVSVTGTLKGVREGDTHTDRAIVTGTPLVECAPSNGDPFNDKTDGGEDTDPEYSTGDVTEIDGKQLCADTQTASNTDDWNGYRAKPLASTGTAVLGLAGGALAVLLAGGSLLVFRKRHRAQGSGRHTAVNAGK